MCIRDRSSPLRVLSQHAGCPSVPAMPPVHAPDGAPCNRHRSPYATGVVAPPGAVVHWGQPPRAAMLALCGLPGSPGEAFQLRAGRFEQQAPPVKATAPSSAHRSVTSRTCSAPLCGASG
eukprot:7656255-Alexandrium_andersonii.AAC.1